MRARAYRGGNQLAPRERERKATQKRQTWLPPCPHLQLGVVAKGGGGEQGREHVREEVGVHGGRERVLGLVLHTRRGQGRRQGQWGGRAINISKAEGQVAQAGTHMVLYPLGHTRLRSTPAAPAC